MYSSFIVDGVEPPKSSDWFVDSGATGTNDISIIKNKIKIDRKEVTVANNDKLTIDSVGSVGSVKFIIFQTFALIFCR